MRSSSATLFLRIGVAFAFLYPAIDSFVQPYSWIDYLPQFLNGILPDVEMLRVFAVFEFVLALWILSGKRILVPSLLAALTLIAIVALNVAEFQLLFRDLSIAAAALALAVSAWKNRLTVDEA